MTHLPKKLEQEMERLAKEQFPHDWASGIDHNESYRTGFEIGFEACYQLMKEREERLDNWAQDVQDKHLDLEMEIIRLKEREERLVEGLKIIAKREYPLAEKLLAELKGDNDEE